MDTSNNSGPQLLIKYTNGDITPQELALLYTCMEKSPALKEKFEEFSDPDNLWDRFWFQHEIDTEEAWKEFKSEHFTEHTPVTEHPPDAGIQINWLQTLLTAAAIVLIVRFVTFAIINGIISNHEEVAEVQSDNNRLLPVPVAQVVTRGYWDLAEKGRVDLEHILEDRIELSGSSILNHGGMFTIENNNKESKETRAISLVTAEKQITLQLPDGSRVTVNKNSSIRLPLPFDSEERTVGFWGEAYFEVKSNPEVPFIVRLNDDAEVKAYGTTFTVNCSGKDCYTTLLRGHVTVTKDGQTKTLSEGEQVQITEGQQRFKVTRADPKKAIAWTRKNGFDFKNIGFKQMMLELGRWYGYEVDFIGEMPQGTCNIKLNEDADLDFLLQTIEKDDNVKIQKTPGNKLIVTNKDKDYAPDYSFKLRNSSHSH